MNFYQKFLWWKITSFYFIYFRKRVHTTIKKTINSWKKNFENLEKSWNFVGQPQWEPWSSDRVVDNFDYGIRRWCQVGVLRTDLPGWGPTDAFNWSCLPAGRPNCRLVPILHNLGRKRWILLWQCQQNNERWKHHTQHCRQRIICCYSPQVLVHCPFYAVLFVCQIVNSQLTVQNVAGEFRVLTLQIFSWKSIWNTELFSDFCSSGSRAVGV